MFRAAILMAEWAPASKTIVRIERSGFDGDFLVGAASCRDPDRGGTPLPQLYSSVRIQISPPSKWVGISPVGAAFQPRRSRLKASPGEPRAGCAGPEQIDRPDFRVLAEHLIQVFEIRDSHSGTKRVWGGGVKRWRRVYQAVWYFVCRVSRRHSACSKLKKGGRAHSHLASLIKALAISSKLLKFLFNISNFWLVGSDFPFS